MDRKIKWALIIGGSLIVVFIAALILIPKFVNVNRYKPQIEAQISKLTGRDFTLDGDLHLSLFPWAGLSFSELHLKNPAGFEKKDFIYLKLLDIKAKFIPLLFKDVQVKRFVLKGMQVVLETRKDGRVNWKFKPKTPTDVSKSNKMPAEVKGTSENRPENFFVLKAFSVREFAITDGSVLWLDHQTKNRKEITDVALHLKDVSLDRPVRLKFSANFDKRPLSIQGYVGPVGKALGKGTVPLDLAVKVLQQMDIKLKGKIKDPAIRPKFDIHAQVSPFSPRKFLAALGKGFTVTAADPKALHLASLKADIKGDSENVSVSDGVMELDETKLNFSVKVANFSKPSIVFHGEVDKIDLYRYLPSQLRKEEEEKTSTPLTYPVKQKSDYSKLRRISLQGTLGIGKLKIKNIKIKNVYLKLFGEKGVFSLRPLRMALYQGGVSGNGRFSVEKDVPRTNVQLALKGVQAAPLLNDLFKKDFLEGTLKAHVNLSMKGDDAEKIKKTLNGTGDLLFKNGAIKGIDLSSMVNNIKAAFGTAQNTGEVPRTDFSELHVPFMVKKGIVHTRRTTLISPLIRVTVSGNADIVKEKLDFRVEPMFVATLKGQGDVQERSGLMVPVLVTGSFDSPKFRPDLEGMLKQKMKKSLPDLQKQLLEGNSQKGESEDIKKQIKDIIKGFKY